MTFQVSPLRIHTVPLEATASEVRLLRVEGTAAGAAGEEALRDALTAHDDGIASHLVIDVGDATRLSAADITALLRHAAELTARNRRLLLVGRSAVVAQVREWTDTAPVLEAFTTVDAALTSCAPVTPADGSGSGSGDDELDRLRKEIRDLRAQVKSRPLISQAQGILQERYELPDASAAFALMRDASQRFNVKLRTVADAVVRVPRPDTDKALWFPGRGRRAAPPTTFLDEARPNRSTVINGVLTEALTVLDSDMGDLQLIEPGGALRMEQHRGFDEDFVDFFSRIDGGDTSCAQAAARRETVTADIRTDPVFTSPAREVILATGSRTAYSIPMTGASRDVVGVFSVHVTRAGQSLSAAQQRRLGEVAGQAGAWLEWHQRTVVLDALEYLHRRGSTLVL